MTEIKKEKLIENIYKWVTKGKEDEIGLEKEKLLKIMVEATLDYLYMKGYIDTDEKEKGNGTI